MIKKINIQFLICLIFITTIVKIFIGWNTDFFYDELMVTSRGYWDWASIFKYTLYDSYHPPLTYLPSKILALLDMLTINKLRLVSIFFSIIPLIYFLLDNSLSRINKFLLILIPLNCYIFSFSLLTTNYMMAYSLFLIFIHRFVQNKSTTSLIWLASLNFFVHYFAGYICVLLLIVKSFKDKDLKDVYQYLSLNIAFILSLFMFNILQYFKQPFEIYSQLFLLISAIIFLNRTFPFVQLLKLLIVISLLYGLETLVYKYNIEINFNLVMFFSQLLIILLLVSSFKNLSLLKLISIALIQYSVFYFNYLGFEYYVLLSTIYFYVLTFFFKREFFSFRYFPIQMIIFWISHKIILQMNVFSKVEGFFTSAPSHSIPLEKYFPYLVLITFIIISLVILRKKLKRIFRENENYFSLIIVFFLFVSTILFFHFTGRTIYMRYNFFTSGLLIFFLAFLFSKMSDSKILPILLGSYLVTNLVFTPSQLSYFNTFQSSDMYKKVTSNGKFADTVFFFTDNSTWHEYYLRDFKLRKNFKVYTLPVCHIDTIKFAMKIAGRNSFLMAYDFECPDLAKLVNEMCSEYDSECFNLKAQNATVMLKMFEPWSQEQNINQLKNELAQ